MYIYIYVNFYIYIDLIAKVDWICDIKKRKIKVNMSYMKKSIQKNMFNAVCLRWVIDQRKETKSWEVCRDRVNMHTDNKKLVGSVIFSQLLQTTFRWITCFQNLTSFSRHEIRLKS